MITTTSRSYPDRVLLTSCYGSYHFCFASIFAFKAASSASFFFASAVKIEIESEHCIIQEKSLKQFQICLK